eukprot:m.3482 g.3482  ORF g.3482 m.3482 type:complete len:274 (+) comp5491_c0_seq2:1-822(+)
MAELPTLGKTCSYCKREDFIPSTCSLCHRIVCSAHIVPASHSCPQEAAQTVPSSTEPLPTQPRQVCQVPACANKAIDLWTCPHCSISACPSHRHPSDHSCSVAEQASVALEARQQHGVAQAERQKAALSKAKLKSALKLAGNAPMAVKLRLLKMKSKASRLGSSSASDTRCLLIGVQDADNAFQIGQGGSFIVPCSWSIGKTIDSVCKHLDLVNTNNDPTQPSWGLYQLIDSDVVALATATDLASMDNGALLVMAQQPVIYSQQLEAALILML